MWNTAVVEYGVKIFLPSPPNYVTRSPGAMMCHAPVYCEWMKFKCAETKRTSKSFHPKALEITGVPIATGIGYGILIGWKNFTTFQSRNHAIPLDNKSKLNYWQIESNCFVCILGYITTITTTKTAIPMTHSASVKITRKSLTVDEPANHSSATFPVSNAFLALIMHTVYKAFFTEHR